MRLKIRAAQTNKKLSTAEALLQLVTLERVSKTSPPLFKALRSKSGTSTPKCATSAHLWGPRELRAGLRQRGSGLFSIPFTRIEIRSARINSCPDTNLVLAKVVFLHPYSCPDTNLALLNTQVSRPVRISPVLKSLFHSMFNRVYRPDSKVNAVFLRVCTRNDDTRNTVFKKLI